MADQRDLTQLVVETDVLQTDMVRSVSQIVVEVDWQPPIILRQLTQEVVEADVLRTDMQRQLMQLVIEVDVQPAEGFMPARNRLQWLPHYRM
jgi:hypothetical protein